MESIKVKIVRTSEDAKIPEYAHDAEVGGNSGCDLFSIEEKTIYPMSAEMFDTGVKVDVPVGVDMQVRSKSGLASKNMLFVLNTPGTIDPNYRGNVKVILFNLGERPYKVNIGDKIAQAVFSPCLHAEFEEVKELSETLRGEGRCQSTGK